MATRGCNNHGELNDEHNCKSPLILRIIYLKTSISANHDMLTMLVMLYVCVCYQKGLWKSLAGAGCSSLC